MTMGSAPLELVALTKAIAHWLSTSLPLSIVAPFLGLLLNVRTEVIWPLLVSTMLGSIALSMIASIGASLTVNLRRGGLLISILVLPLYVPVLVFGISATSGMADIVAPSLLILSAIALASLVLAPIASAAALRAYLK
jgi:heme exporter protein B